EIKCFNNFQTLLLCEKLYGERKILPKEIMHIVQTYLLDWLVGVYPGNKEPVAFCYRLWNVHDIRFEEKKLGKNWHSVSSATMTTSDKCHLLVIGGMHIDVSDQITLYDKNLNRIASTRLKVARYNHSAIRLNSEGDVLICGGFTTLSVTGSAEL